MVKRSMLLVSNVSDAVLELSLPDEEMIPIRTSGMIIALGRHSLSKLSGLPIEIDEGKFVFPADSNLLDTHASNTSFVDTQVHPNSNV